MRSRTVLAPPHPSAVLQNVDRKGMWGCDRTVTQMPTITRTRTKPSLPFLHVPASETSQLFPPPPSQPHTPALLGAGGGAPLDAMPHTPAPGSAGGGAHRITVASPTCKGRKCCVFFFFCGGGGGRMCHIQREKMLCFFFFFFFSGGGRMCFLYLLSRVVVRVV